MRKSVVLEAALFTVILLALVALVLFSRPGIPGSREPLMARYESAKRELMDAVRERGPREALDRLQHVAASDADIAGLCHGLSHEVGYAAHEALGFTGALAVQEDVCGSGYLHGIIERELSYDIAGLESRFRTLCPPGDARCFHGLGHGLMYATENDLPGSLRRCAIFSLPFQRIQCGEGVFMENFEADGAAHPSGYLFPEDPYRTCRGQPEPEKGICTFYFPRYFLRVHPGAYADLFAFCETLPEDSMPACFKGAGSAAMKASVLTPERALAQCESAAPAARQHCVEGLLSYLIVHYASVREAREFCEESFASAWRFVCARSLAEGERAYGAE